MRQSIYCRHIRWEDYQLKLTLCDVLANPVTRDILTKPGFMVLVTFECCKTQLSVPQMDKTQASDSKRGMF